jgi:hypothetical protein
MKKQAPLSDIEKLIMGIVVAPMAPGILLFVVVSLFYSDIITMSSLAPLSSAHGILLAGYHRILAIPLKIFELLGVDIFMGSTIGMLLLAMSAGLAYPALIIGFPVYYVFRRLKWDSLCAYCLGGPAVGLIYYLLIQLLNHKTLTIPVVVFKVAGGISAVTFWLIVRPDKLTNVSKNITKTNQQM